MQATQRRFKVNDTRKLESLYRTHLMIYDFLLIIESISSKLKYVQRDYSGIHY
jgi:hypothetical protein